MTKKDFSRLQAKLETLGYTTAIVKTGKGKTSRYEVVVNMELKKKYKTRMSAKRFIEKLQPTQL